MFDKAMVQIYTGKGKGKTTAAVGSAIRAAGHGGKVLFYQFLKPPNLDLGERKALESLDNITVETIDDHWDMAEHIAGKEEAKLMAEKIQQTLHSVTQIAAERKFDMIILDEIIYCYSQNLAELDDIQNLVLKRDDGVELILTGRGADKKLNKIADLVTEMKQLKHPFEKGIKARKGIEY
jgi:cob(I)alamin adenosyltransferase